MALKNELTMMRAAAANPWWNDEPILTPAWNVGEGQGGAAPIS